MRTRELSPQFLCGSLHSFCTHSFSLTHTPGTTPVSHSTNTEKESTLRYSSKIDTLVARYSQVPCYQSLSFTFSILAYSRKTLQESSKIFVEHVVLLLGYSLEPRTYSRVLGTVSSVMPSVYHIKDART